MNEIISDGNNKRSRKSYGFDWKQKVLAADGLRTQARGFKSEVRIVKMQGILSD
ncbi:MAG: hypothetical protein LKG21_03690 [Ruminococcus sp.]|jgi:hypothetical protein|nr:hypothetical protein [Ruminococcus sp.]